MGQSEAMRNNRADSLVRRAPMAGATFAGASSQRFEGRAKLSNACAIELHRLRPDPDQPRKSFESESIDRLAGSFKARGQLVPILVRWSDDSGCYVIIDGERRYRAALLAGLPSMTCLVKDDAQADDLLEIQLVTNALRDDVPPVELARAYEALIAQKGYTHRELADRLNVTHATVTKALALLGLSPDLQAKVDGGALRPSVAYEVAKIEDPEEQAEVVERIEAERLSRDEVAQVVRQAKDRKPSQKGRGAAKGRLSTERTIRVDGGFKVVVSHRRPFDEATLWEVVRKLVAMTPSDAEAA